MILVLGGDIMWLAHHGVKGQKWGVRRYQNYDGTRIKNKSDIVLSKDTKLYRFSNKKENGSLKGTYVSHTPSDVNEYYLDAKHARLGFKNYNKIMMTEISLVDDITIRRGKDTVKDILDKIGDKKLTQYYNHLDKIGFLDDNKSSYDRMKIWQSSKESKKARKAIGNAMNKYSFNNKETRNKMIDEYSKKYDAIVDPEDFIWNYERPMIITNEKKFKRNNQRVVYNNSYSNFLKKRKKESNKKNESEWYEYNDDKIKF